MRILARAVSLVAAVLLMAALSGGSAQAHPLGNFTVNHYDGLTLRPDRVEVESVVDSAELPTAQEVPQIDTNRDGVLSAQELSAFAAVQCPVIASAVRSSVTPTAGGGSQNLTFAVDASAGEVVPGSAGLPTLRITCQLSAPADLRAPATVDYTNSFRADRVGWKEITVTGSGVRTIDSPVPTDTVSNKLRRYQGDLLSSPLNVASVQVSVAPGSGGTARGFALPTGGGDPFTRVVVQADRSLQDLVGGTLTPLIGALAVLLALLLGAGHAVLPGHGKTVMAAYLAGKRGSRRDALTVGATVTITHTIGVLIIGVLLSVGSTFAGEQALRWLGVISGVLVAAIGLGLLRSAVLARRARSAAIVSELALVGAGPGGIERSAQSAPDGHGHGHGHGEDDGYSRRGLIGMGVAGGLVPSPSATLVLVASLGLGRTVFGVILVFVYGLGMAGTLTLVGLLLVRVRSRLDAARDSDRLSARIGRRVQTLSTVLPVGTAILVFVVGAGLVARGVLNPY